MEGAARDAFLLGLTASIYVATCGTMPRTPHHRQDCNGSVAFPDNLGLWRKLNYVAISEFLAKFSQNNALRELAAFLESKVVGKVPLASSVVPDDWVSDRVTAARVSMDLL